MKINKGDIFRVGNHIIGCGDSLDKEFVAKVIGFYFGDQSKSIAQWLGRSMYIVLAGTVIFSVIFFLWKKKCGKKGS